MLLEYDVLFAWLFYFYFIKVLFLLSAKLRKKKRERNRTHHTENAKKMFLSYLM